MFKPKFSGSSNNFDTGFKTQKSDFDTDFDGYEVLKGDKGDKGDPGEQGPPGIDGVDGVGIDYITLIDGKLILVLTDGTKTDLGNIMGPQGEQGPEGP
jgi:hypothetical protein